MGRAPCCSKDADLNRGAWTAEEDLILTEYIAIHGNGGWKSLPQKAGLKRCGKSCRLRWLNYLRPDIKRGNISHDEEELIMRMHKLLGNRWSLIAGRLPGRTDNEIKNYWNTRLFRKIERGESRAPHEEKFIGKAKCPSHDPKNDDHVYKVVPVRTTVSRIENLHKRDLKSSISDNNIKLHASSNTKISKSWCELWTDELTADELVDIKLDQNSNSQPIEANEKISHFLTPNLIDDQFPHPAENETYAHNTSSNLNEISSYNCDLFSSMNAFSDDFRIGESESRQTNGIEKIYGKENFETFADCRDQVMEETSIDVDQVDWIKELLDCQI